MKMVRRRISGPRPFFVQGREKALEYFETGGEGLLLDEDNTLYVSKALQASFELAAEAEGAYHVVFL